MTPQLQRIETTLHNLADPAARNAVRPRPVEPGAPAAQAASPLLSFDLRVPSDPKVLSAPTPIGLPTLALPKSIALPQALPQPDRPQPVPPGADPLADTLPAPLLPKLKPTSFTSHRNAANPGLALGLLTEMASTVSQWQAELHQLLRQIHSLYAEGPIVAGWLESYAQDDRPAPELRHVEVDCLADWVETQWSEAIAAPTAAAPPSLLDAAGYRLCGLKEDGQLWSRHCPAAQVPAVSMAIARHQQLRQLLARKQHLETHLGQLSERLITLHGEITLRVSANAPASTRD